MNLENIDVVVSMNQTSKGLYKVDQYSSLSPKTPISIIPWPFIPSTWTEVNTIITKQQAPAQQPE